MVDDDGETIAVLGAGRISALNATALAWQAEVRRNIDCHCIFSPLPFFSLYFSFSSRYMLRHLRFKMHNIINILK